ncbi:hypothetical protein M513_09720 [Trichuris suis]|uniref:G-protein coupled receptors family 1 profile domain-containing protein n=2 Tax=Trichuris suis TaxID=68888 RepID=A0A085LWV7_9BILA|nr:hypothetical protein M513_09720 [Trichuris suis]
MQLAFFVSANATGTSNATFANQTVAQHNGQVDYINIFLACNAITALIFDACLILTVKRRSGRRADLILITGFAVGNGLTSIARVMTSVMRASLYLNKDEMMDPFTCILMRYDLGILVIGQDGLTLSGFLLSFERFMFFTNVNAHQRIFNPVCTKQIIYCAFIVGILDYMLCWSLAYSRRSEQIQGHCQRSETTSESYFTVYMILTVLLAAGSLIFYLLTFLSVSSWGRQNNEKGLRQLRHSRERKILNSLALVSVLIAAMNLLPWSTYFFIFNSSSHQVIFNAAKLLDNLYLPISTLLYFIIHPDLSRPLRSTFCVRNCLKFLSRSERISVVYAG